MPLLERFVLAAAAWCAAALLWQYRAMKAFGPRRLNAPPAGDSAAGVRYAFTAGMAPQAKESVRMNLVSYGLGMGYHLGVFAALAQLPLNLAGAGTWRLLALVTVIGAVCGMSLLVKRATVLSLRALSHPDDYLSNLLGTVFAGLAGAAAFVPGLSSTWMASALLLLVWAPLGKIRHCVFFFPTRAHFGRFFGRRGVLPTAMEGGR